MKLSIVAILTLAVVSAIADTFWMPDNAQTTLINNFIQDGKLILQWKKVTPSNAIYCGGAPAGEAMAVPDKIEIWEDFYCASNGQVILGKTLAGTYFPAQTQTTPERFNWPTNQ